MFGTEISVPYIEPELLLSRIHQFCLAWNLCGRSHQGCVVLLFVGCCYCLKCHTSHPKLQFCEVNDVPRFARDSSFKWITWDVLSWHKQEGYRLKSHAVSYGPVLSDLWAVTTVELASWPFAGGNWTIAKLHLSHCQAILERFELFFFQMWLFGGRGSWTVAQKLKVALKSFWWFLCEFLWRFSPPYQPSRTARSKKSNETIHSFTFFLWFRLHIMWSCKALCTM